MKRNFEPQVEIPENYFVENFRRFKKAKEYTNAKIGELSGMHENTIDSLARGVTQPKLDFVALISVLSGYSIDDLCYKKLYLNENEEDYEKIKNMSIDEMAEYIGTKEWLESEAKE